MAICPICPICPIVKFGEAVQKECARLTLEVGDMAMKCVVRSLSQSDLAQLSNLLPRRHQQLLEMVLTLKRGCQRVVAGPGSGNGRRFRFAAFRGR